MSERPDGPRPAVLGVWGLVLGFAQLGLGVLGLIRAYGTESGAADSGFLVFAWGFTATGIGHLILWLLQRRRERRR